MFQALPLSVKCTEIRPGCAQSTTRKKLPQRVGKVGCPGSKVTTQITVLALSSGMSLGGVGSLLVWGFTAGLLRVFPSQACCGN